MQELRWQQSATAGGASVPDASAVAAKHAYLTVQGAVALLQLQQVGAGRDSWSKGRVGASADTCRPASPRGGIGRHPAARMLGGSGRRSHAAARARCLVRQPAPVAQVVAAHLPLASSACPCACRCRCCRRVTSLWTRPARLSPTPMCGGARCGSRPRSRWPSRSACTAPSASRAARRGRPTLRWRGCPRT